MKPTLASIRQVIQKDFPDSEIRGICAVAKTHLWETINCDLSAVLDLASKGYRRFRFRILPPFEDEVSTTYSIRDLCPAEWDKGDSLVLDYKGKRRAKIVAVEGEEAALAFALDGQIHHWVIDRYCALVLKVKMTRAWRKRLQDIDLEWV